MFLCALVEINNHEHENKQLRAEEYSWLVKGKTNSALLFFLT